MNKRPPNSEEKPMHNLWNHNQEIYNLLQKASTLEEARESFFDYLHKQERSLLEIDNSIFALEKVNIQECLKVLKNIIAPLNEARTKISALQILFDLAHGKETEELSEGFLLEFEHLFKGLLGNSGIYKTLPKKEEVILKGREAALARSAKLDIESDLIKEKAARFPTGLDTTVIKEREENKNRILEHFNATEKDWNDHLWHFRNIIKDADTLKNLIDLTSDEEAAIRLAKLHRIPFGVTPYYASLMDKEPSRTRDYSVRSMVLPPLSYVKALIKNKNDRTSQFDFMGEADTSPVKLVTRRYPQVAIFKPYNTCPQICVYCQRNWEIDDAMDPKAMASKPCIDKALAWFEAHPTVEDILVTGGDSCTMPDAMMKYVLDKLCSFDHIKRIRISTRTPVTIPQRITDNLANLFGSYQDPGKREVVMVTHFEHPWEITPEAISAVQKIRKQGITVYNQAVYTFENSRKFELVALRQQLRQIGVDPYYTFNAKGKEETKDYRVPIARLLQERKEEARLLPGISRTDEPVFNVPRLGKNHLRAWQDHQVIMITPEGRRVYEFHPWEKNLVAVEPFCYTDVSIHEYLKSLKKRNENTEDYRTIWYYF
jgi:lysine 2,3-aminomutase